MARHRGRPDTAGNIADRSGSFVEQGDVPFPEIYRIAGIEESLLGAQMEVTQGKRTGSVPEAVELLAVNAENEAGGIPLGQRGRLHGNRTAGGNRAPRGCG